MRDTRWPLPGCRKRFNVHCTEGRLCLVSIQCSGAETGTEVEAVHPILGCVPCMDTECMKASMSVHRALG